MGQVTATSGEAGCRGNLVFSFFWLHSFTEKLEQSGRDCRETEAPLHRK